MDTFADVQPLPVDWLLPGMIAMGETTVLAARGGSSKTFLACDLAARVTTGAGMPDSTAGGPPGDVIVVSAEDDPNTSLVWRLMAAGADLARVVNLCDVDGVPFSLPGHFTALRQAIAAADNCRLIVLDPLSGLSDISLTAVATVRRQIMRPLQCVARDFGVALLLVHHLTKDGKTVAGSAAVVDTTRSALLVEPDPDNPAIKVVRVHKTNIGAPSTPALRYRLSGDWPATSIEWLDAETADAGPAMRRVLMALRNSGHPLTTQQLATMTGLNHGHVRVIVHRLGKSGVIESPGKGLYTAA
jgi:putative DNA primase/helicase